MRVLTSSGKAPVSGQGCEVLCCLILEFQGRAGGLGDQAKKILRYKRVRGHPFLAQKGLPFPS